LISSIPRIQEVTLLHEYDSSLEIQSMLIRRLDGRKRLLEDSHSSAFGDFTHDSSIQRTQEVALLRVLFQSFNPKFAHSEDGPIPNGDVSIDWRFRFGLARCEDTHTSSTVTISSIMKLLLSFLVISCAAARHRNVLRLEDDAFFHRLLILKDSLPPEQPPTDWKRRGTPLGSSDVSFGQAVALSNDGSILAVSAPTDDYGGVVELHRWDNATAEWNLVHYQSPITLTTKFCTSMGISSDGYTVACGSGYTETTNAMVGGNVQVFVKNENDEWTLKGQLFEGVRDCESLGWSVALSGDGSRLVVAAPGRYKFRCRDVDLDERRGRVQVYDYNRNNNEWEQVGSTIVGAQLIDQLGTDTAISQDGARMAVATSSTQASYAVYELINGDWIQMGNNLEPPGTTHAGLNTRGVSLSADGNRIAFATKSLHNDTSGIALAHVYEWNTMLEVWKQIGNDIQDPDQCCDVDLSVSLSNDGRTLVVGSQSWGASIAHSLLGVARIYYESNGVWNQVGENIEGQRYAPDIVQWSSLGYASAVSGDGSVIAVGAPDNQSVTVVELEKTSLSR